MQQQRLCAAIICRDLPKGVIFRGDAFAAGGEASRDIEAWESASHYPMPSLFPGGGLRRARRAMS